MSVITDLAFSNLFPCHFSLYIQTLERVRILLYQHAECNWAQTEEKQLIGGIFILLCLRGDDLFLSRTEEGEFLVALLCH